MAKAIDGCSAGLERGVLEDVEMTASASLLQQY